MQQHSTLRGLVIREVDFGDHDRFITVLSETGRRLEVLCRGVRRKNSRTAAAVRLFCFSELTVFSARSQLMLDDAAVVHSFWNVTQDIERYALACYFAELIALLSSAEEDNPDVARLMLYALHVLCAVKRPPEIVKAAFELRLMALTGYAPRVEAGCAVCGGPMRGARFSVREGTAVCGGCAARVGADWRPVGAGVLAAMRYVLSCELPRVFSFTLGGESLQQLAALCETYVLYRMERGFESLELYRSLHRPIQIRKSGATK